ncbi:hypothetical protein E2562_032850 [Oryza meyeriana var. granulata]|uniref:Uncharacterized protein n=1 Tax=Oryza meyeriana var. granulata TaxID=110450 RepID=A0A6G1DR02_9ORYZ|nr:hypothetical protein E2562_032850 [Oryza meyeriana var. granulata]
MSDAGSPFFHIQRASLSSMSSLLRPRSVLGLDHSETKPKGKTTLLERSCVVSSAMAADRSSPPPVRAWVEQAPQEAPSVAVLLPVPCPRVLPHVGAQLPPT